MQGVQNANFARLIRASCMKGVAHYLFAHFAVSAAF